MAPNGLLSERTEGMEEGEVQLLQQSTSTAQEEGSEIVKSSEDEDPEGLEQDSNHDNKGDGEIPSEEGPPPSDGDHDEAAARIAQEQEAQLQAFLNKNKPKKLSIKEMLMNMPGYDKLAQVKPKIGVGVGSQRGSGGGGGGFIDFDEEEEEKDKKKKQGKRSTKKMKAIDDLIERFAKHAGTPAATDKQERYKIHINSVEKDSQGLFHSVSDEIDYVATPEDPDGCVDDILSEVNSLNRPSGLGTSPRGREQIPGEKMFRLKQALRESIRKKKAKEYEEKMKLHLMYSEEKKSEDKGEEGEDDEEEEEILEDDGEDDLVDSEEEEEEDEEMEFTSRKKKKRRRLLMFVDDEAEDEDGPQVSSSEDEDEDEIPEDVEKPVENEDEDEVLLDIDEMEEKTTQDQNESQAEQYSSQPETTVVKESEEGRRKWFQENADFLISTQSQKSRFENKLNSNSESIDKERGNEERSELFNTKIPIIGECPDFLGGLMTSEIKAGPQIVIPNRIEGKDKEDETDSVNMSEGISVSFSKSSNTEYNEKEDDEEEMVIKKVKKSKPKRLLYSDDEDEDENKEAESQQSLEERDNKSDEEALEEEDPNPEDDNPEPEDAFDDDEDDEEAQYERQLQQADELTPKRPLGLMGKDGKLRRKFFEYEAELSGSEAGSEDEDERGPDDYEKEECDEEELDEDGVRMIERAHLKQLLDEDDREIRFLQEEYFKDGDLHQENQRERKFKWSGLDDGWGDGDDARMGDSDGEGEIDDETEEEMKRKIEEIEKKKWIHDNSQLFEGSEEDSIKTMVEKSRFLKLGKSTMRKIENVLDSSSQSFIVGEASNTSCDPGFLAALMKSKIKASAKTTLSTSSHSQNGVPDKEDETDSIRKAQSQPLFSSPDESTSKFIKRGSFLSRESPVLSRLAEMTKANDPTSNVKSNSRNFVFSTVTPPEQNSKQTKAPKRPAYSQGNQPKKLVKVDRSFSTLDDCSKDASVFKWM